jgi:molybdopterin-guanine dinucleotide biosynthesis protein A
MAYASASTAPLQYRACGLAGREIMAAPIRPSRAGFLLAGGKSSRMGADKAFLEIGKQTLLDRAFTAMAPVCDSVTIVGDPVRFAKYKPVVADIFPECGPLAGIHSALAHSAADLNLMLAVDMPFVSTELLVFLLAAAESTAAVITVPHTNRGLQPLCAVYRRDFMAVAAAALRAGKYKIDAAFSQVSTLAVTASDLAAAGFAERCFFNVNTPEDRLSL